MTIPKRNWKKTQAYGMGFNPYGNARSVGTVHGPLITLRHLVHEVAFGEYAFLSHDDTLTDLSLHCLAAADFIIAAGGDGIPADTRAVDNLHPHQLDWENQRRSDA